MTALLHVNGVHKAFGTNPVLRGLEVSLEPHEVVALIGSSGSGKSTLLRCVNGLESIDAGRIMLGDVEVSALDADLDVVRRRVGIVFQAYNLFPHMSVLANVTLAPIRVLRHSRKQAEGASLELLARLGLAEKARQYPDQLSGGQQQRVAIARALAMQPELLLLDEVTSALDPELVGEVLDVIRDLKAGGMTILMATHEMAFAREVADRVCFLDRGRVLESGPPGEIFENPAEPRTREFLDRFLSG
ncbi:MAG: amino acid ABC transporter ATP-binding protein [Actinomycetes bacterium]